MIGVEEIPDEDDGGATGAPGQSQFLEPRGVTYADIGIQSADDFLADGDTNFIGAVQSSDERHVYADGVQRV